MVDENLVKVESKLRGTKELRDSLLSGDIKSIGESFGMSYINAYNLVVGKSTGNNGVILCAQELAGFYNEVKLRETVKQIIDKHGKLNQDRN